MFIVIIFSEFHCKNNLRNLLTKPQKNKRKLFSLRSNCTNHVQNRTD